MLLAALALLAGTAEAQTAAPAVDFARDVQPIFAARCIGCHGPAKQRGGLRLDGGTAVKKGGHSGVIVVAGKADESLLLQHSTAALGAGRMPPKGDPLTGEQIATLRRWIEAGAVAPDDPPAAAGAEALAWSFRPLVRPPVPVPPADQAAWVRTPVDAFVLEKLTANGLKPSPEAERRILARRSALDLTGLPPTPEELDAFLADSAADAYEKWVDRLLASPRYGERWARHWLDVAHYADSHGNDQDRPRENAWPYRDYVIRAFNDDKPYGRFVREQVAGDVLFPDDPAALAATGFLAAGPWDESGLRDINEKSIDRLVAQNLDRDDVVTSTMSTFTALTVGCARCHDHKFDPITQEDYYALQAVFAGVDKAERAYDPDPAVAQRRAALAADLALVRSLAGKTDPRLLTPERRAEAAAFEQSRKAAETRWTTPAPQSWQSKHGATLRALEDRSILSTGEAPLRDVYTVQLDVDQPQLTALRLEVLCDDSLPLRGPGREPNGNLHLSEVRVAAHPRGKPELAVKVLLRSAIADFDQAGWAVPRALDGDSTTAWGVYPEVGKPHQAIFEFEKPISFEGGTTLRVELEQSHGGHLIGRFRLSAAVGAPLGEDARPLPPAVADALAAAEPQRTDLQTAELARWTWEKRLLRETAELPAQAKVYCGTNRFAPDGSFRPAAAPRPVFVLARGEILKPLGAAAPGAVASVPGLEGRFRLNNADDEGARRAALAEWIASDANPLTWRVAANRVWGWHFGKGIVDTPNDFGEMGGSPSHPELLDWLAAELRDGGGSLKSLHRTILRSSTYRQAVGRDAAAAAKDADARLLWRAPRGRLEAEMIRDSLLHACGKLDLTMYGPAVKHFVTAAGVHVTLKVDYGPVDLEAAGARRRSIYRFAFRTQPDPFLEALDCPDASLSAPVRSTSLGAPQALALWNNKFTLRCSELLAARAEAASKEPAAQVREVCRRLLLRAPTAEEEAAWTAYARKHGLANFVRVVANSSEFLFID